MTRKELIYILKREENEIINILKSLGYESEYSNGKKISNPMMGYINNRFNIGFYDCNTKMIKEKLGLGSNISIISILNSKHLEYRIAVLRSFKKELPNYRYFFENEKRKLIVCAAEITGKRYRSKFLEEYRVKPITDLQKLNPTNVIKEKIIHDLDCLKDVTREELLKETLNKSKKLQQELPKHFKEEKAYGEAIGSLTKSTYGNNTGDIKRTFKSKNIKIPNDNILYLMNNEHLLYRYISLSLIEKYAKIYSKDEYNMFIEKCSLIGFLSRQIFIEKNPNKDMYRDLIDIETNIHNVKISENALKASYSLKQNTEFLIGVENEQMSMFDKPKTRIKDKLEENNE